MIRQTGLPRRVLPKPVAFGLLVSVIVVFLAASSAPTPLYGTYQQMWHFSPITTTVVFGVYAVAVLITLLVVGRLSDHVGRRPVLLAAIALQFPATVLLLTAPGVPELLLGRVLQGVATGAAAGAIGAGLLDLDNRRGSLANSVGAPLGTASGSLVSAVFVQYLPAPTHLVYAALLGVFAVQFAGVLLMAETVTPKPGALASLRPEFTVPLRARGPLLVAVPALVAGWSLAGLYGSLAPAVVHDIAGSSWLLLGGLPLFVAAGAGALTVLFGRDRKPVPLMLLSTVSLSAGIGLTLVGQGISSLTAFFAGTVIAGVGFGAAFQGTIKMVVPLAHAHERAGLLSVVYTAAYLAMGVPAIVAGWLVVHGGGLTDTFREYSAFAIALAVLAFAGLVRQALRDRAPAGAAAGSRTQCGEELLVEQAV